MPRLARALRDRALAVKLDRLGRSTRGALNPVHELEQKARILHFGRRRLHDGAWHCRRDGTQVRPGAPARGIEAAKAKGGVYKGRKPSVTGRRGA
jgi:hypothetical protein